MNAAWDLTKSINTIKKAKKFNYIDVIIAQKITVMMKGEIICYT